MTEPNGIFKSNPLFADAFAIARLNGHSYPTGEPFRLKDNQVLLLEKAKGTLLVNDKEMDLKDQSLALITKGQVYTFGANKMTGYVLQFGDCFWEKTPQSASNCKAVLFDSHNTEQQFLLQEKEYRNLSVLFDAALQDFEDSDYSNKPDALAAFLKIIIIKIANVHALLQKDAATYDVQLYQQFLNLLQQEASKVHDVNAYAGKLGITPRKLSAICRAMGKGAKEIINEQLIAEAKRSLQFSNRSVKEIAGNLHFANPYQFSHFFKKYTRLSPVAFKKQFVEIGI